VWLEEAVEKLRSLWSDSNLVLAASLVAFSLSAIPWWWATKWLEAHGVPEDMASGLVTLAALGGVFVLGQLLNLPSWLRRYW
jgi:hypothetical protein